MKESHLVIASIQYRLTVNQGFFTETEKLQLPKLCSPYRSQGTFPVEEDRGNFCGPVIEAESQEGQPFIHTFGGNRSFLDHWNEILKDTKIIWLLAISNYMVSNKQYDQVKSNNMSTEFKQCHSCSHSLQDQRNQLGNQPCLPVSQHQTLLYSLLSRSGNYVRSVREMNVNLLMQGKCEANFNIQKNVQY